MATFNKLPSGNWRVQIRRKGKYASDTFKRKRDGEVWALEIERRIDRGDFLSTSKPAAASTLGDLINIHLADMAGVGRAPRRSKAYSLESLKRRLGHVAVAEMTRERLVAYGRQRGREGAGPATLGAELSYIGTIVTHAAAIHGIAVSKEPVELARIALKRLGLVGRAKERERRPTQDEIDRIIDYLDSNLRQSIPVGRIVRFAIATAMREEEMCRIEWSDIDPKTRTVVVRDRKDPRNKDGNDQKVPLLAVTGYDAWIVLQEQKLSTSGFGRVFPYNSKSVGAAFRRACRVLCIKDLRFHDLRHEATSRLFEAGLSIEQVALVTGHRDWKMLKRYTNLRPEHLHEVIAITKTRSP